MRLTSCDRSTIMIRIILCCCLIVSWQALAISQEPSQTLSDFFQQRLTARVGTPPPSYEALLRVTDRIAGSSASDIAAALPLLSAALKREDGDLAVQAAFALSVIARRPDGGGLLRTRISEVGALLERPDDRLSGGAVLIMRSIMPSNLDLTVPVLMEHLSSADKPSLVKAEVVSLLLEYRRNDPQVLRAIESFVNLGADPKVRISVLKVLAARRVKTPIISGFLLRSLDDSNKFVKAAAIYAVYAVGSDTWDRAKPVLSRMALNPGEDQEVRALADKAMRNTLMMPRRQ